MANLPIPSGSCRKGTKKVPLGSLVRVADRAALEVALRRAGVVRPEPAQMLWAGRTARVTGYRRGPEGRALYLLKGAPGLWLGEWIDPS